MSRRINPSRKSTVSIMSHGGYGDLKVINNNLKVTIPNTCIKEDGSIRRNIKALLNELTIENVSKLNKDYGVIFEKLA